VQKGRKNPHQYLTFKTQTTQPRRWQMQIIPKISSTNTKSTIKSNKIDTEIKAAKAQ